MATVVLIQQIELPVPGIEQMQAEARKEGYSFLETLVKEWLNGKNRFDASGEILCGHLDQGLLVAVGGLNCDPFLGDPTVGRIRRLYVRQAWRSRGIGGALLDRLLDVARQNFCRVRLRAEMREQPVSTNARHSNQPLVAVRLTPCVSTAIEKHSSIEATQRMKFTRHSFKHRVMVEWPTMQTLLATFR